MKTTKSKTRKNPKRFYITRTAVNNPLMLKTLDNAITAGRLSVEVGHGDTIYVVEIVKVIKREKPPVGVFDFMLED